MSALRVLLVQIRAEGDAMLSHEAESVRMRLGPRAHVSTRNALERQADAAWVDGFNAVVIGGSGDFSVHHPQSEPWVSPLRRLLDRVLHDRVPTFGICFGHQLLAHHLGARVDTAEAQAELGTVPLRLTAAGTSDPVFGVLGGSFEAHTGHSDHVTALPPDLELMAEGDRCAHQAFRHRAAPFFTTQFHPDLTGAEAIARYLAYRKHLSPEKAAEASARFKAGSDSANALLTAFLDYAARA